MNDKANELSAAERAQIRANLGLVRRFVRELIEEPPSRDVLPDEGTVVLLPPDEPGDAALTFANVEMARQLVAEGEHPILWAVGMPPREGLQVAVHFPIVREDQIAIRYDRRQDRLTVAFSQTERPTMPLRRHSLVITLVDPETYLVVAYTIPNFLTVVAPKSLALFDLLLLSFAELVGITREEVLDRRNALAHGRPLPSGERLNVGEVLREIGLLSA